MKTAIHIAYALTVAAFVIFGQLIGMTYGDGE